MAKLVQIFCPVTTKWSPSASARVDSAARSDPAPGSEKPWHQMSSPRRMRGRWKAFCSSLARAISVGPAWLSPTKVESMAGSPARAYKISCGGVATPRPPYSFGQAMPAQPPSHCVRCQARSYSRMPPSQECGLGSLGAFSASQVRTSSRNSACSAEKSRSTPASVSTEEIGHLVYVSSQDKVPSELGFSMFTHLHPSSSRLVSDSKCTL